MSDHELTHYEMSDESGLTPGCVCGWYSPRREHADFERHTARQQVRPDIPGRVPVAAHTAGTQHRTNKRTGE